MDSIVSEPVWCTSCASISFLWATYTRQGRTRRSNNWSGDISFKLKSTYQNLQVSHLHGWVLSACQLVNKKWTCFCFSFFCSYLYCIQFFQDTGIQWHWHNCNIRHAGSQSFDELRVRSQLHPCNPTIPQSHRPNCIVLQKMSCLYLQNTQHTSSGTRGRQGHARPSLHGNLYMRKQCKLS